MHKHELYSILLIFWGLKTNKKKLKCMYFRIFFKHHLAAFPWRQIISGEFREHIHHMNVQHVWAPAACQATHADPYLTPDTSALWMERSWQPCLFLIAPAITIWAVHKTLNSICHQGLFGMHVQKRLVVNNKDWYTVH